ALAVSLFLRRGSRRMVHGLRRRQAHRTGGDRCVPQRLLREPQDALQFEESGIAAKRRKRRKKIQLLCFLCLFVAQNFCVQYYSLISKALNRLSGRFWTHD